MLEIIKLRSLFKIDWLLFLSAVILSIFGLVTMNSFTGDNLFFEKQIIWLIVSITVFFFLSTIDFRFLKKTWVIISLFIISVLSLSTLFVLGNVVQGSQRWLDLGFLSVQVSEPTKLVLILLLSKYFTKRHIEIANLKHVLISGFYAFILFFLVFLQPDFGSSIIIFLIWLGMVLVSGISKKHLFMVFSVVVISFVLLWSFAFHDYQKQRIVTFINPLTDLSGAGYNAYQSMIAVGSGGLFGKGVGFGTQSKLQFLPEHQTDFIFASFAEEWGFFGILIIFFLFSILIWRILVNAKLGLSNFEILFCLGLAVLFISQFVIHVGMNIGILPITGTPLPFVSYGGSHLLVEFIGLGILMGMRKYRRVVHKDDVNNNEIPGV